MSTIDEAEKSGVALSMSREDIRRELALVKGHIARAERELKHWQNRLANLQAQCPHGEVTEFSVYTGGGHASVVNPATSVVDVRVCLDCGKRVG